MAPIKNSRISRHNCQRLTEMNTSQWFKMLLISSAILSSVPASFSLSLSRTKQGSFLKISNLAPIRQCRVGRKESRLGGHSTVQLRYRFGDDEENTIYRFQHFEAASRANNRVISPATGNTFEKVDDEKHELDDYLKFVEKRYNRLHTEEDESSGFSMTWKWFSGNTSTNSMTAAKKRHETVMEVLGLSELASRQVVKKHDPSQYIEEYSSSDTSFIHPVSVDRSVMFSPNLASKVSVINRLQSRYLALIGIELRAALFNCIRYIGRDILYLTTLTKKVLIASTSRGAAKKVVTGALLASFAIFAFFRPFLTQGVPSA